MEHPGCGMSNIRFDIPGFPILDLEQVPPKPSQPAFWMALLSMISLELFARRAIGTVGQSRWTVARTGVGFLISCAAFGQSATAPPQFEVAAIRANKSGDTTGQTLGIPQSGLLVWRYVHLRNLIMLAYDVPMDDIAGGPGWLGSDRFDITAKAPPNTSRSEIHMMLRTLLADRFGLVVHQDQKVMPVFALVAGKRGPSLAPAAGSDQPHCISGPATEGRIHRECINMTSPAFCGVWPPATSPAR
jgi:hypothetical protein